MKKILLSLGFLMMFSGSTFALDNEPEEGFTFMGLFGLNVSKLQNTDYGAKPGAMLGARVDYVLPSAHGTYLTAGLDWSMKGGKFTEDVYDITNVALYSSTWKYNLHYFEVPIRVGFRYNISDEVGLYGEVGPYFAVGVGGKHKMKIDADGEAYNLIEDANTFKAFKNYGYPVHSFQRWDAGIGFRVGCEYNQHYNLLIGCDWGLCDIYRNRLRDDYYDQADVKLPKIKNFNFSITLGYRL